MGCGKRAFCRKQQAPAIALVQCNSPSKECSRLSLSSRPSSSPKHLRNVGKEEEVSTKDPQELLHSGGRVIHAIKATLKTGEQDKTPLQSVETAVYELYTQSAVMRFTHRFHQHGHKGRPKCITGACQLIWAHSLAEWAWCTQECTCRKQRSLVFTHNCGKNKMAVSRYPVPCLKNNLYKSQTWKS